MVAPATQEVLSSKSAQRRRKGTIASRYLEAIGIQCGGDLNVNSSKNAFRSTPISKKQSDNNRDDQVYISFDQTKRKTGSLGPITVYDKISATAKTADCSKSIITASTAVMLDGSDSMSTATATSRGGSGVGKFQRSSPQRIPMGRGRSRTPGKTGTNSKFNSKGISDGYNPTNNRDDCDDEYVHPPGSRSTAPLSDGFTSSPSTPTRLNQRLRPCTPLTTKSIMGIDNSESDFSSGETSHPDSRLGLTGLPDISKVTDFNEAQSSNSTPSQSRGRGVFPKTNPRMPSVSPGPQPRSPGQYSHLQKQAQCQEQESTLSISDLRHNTVHSTKSRHQRENDITLRSLNDPHSHFEIEAAPPSSHEPTDSEAGAPTEITKNHGNLYRPYNLRRPSIGNGGNKVHSKNRSSSNMADISSRIRDRVKDQCLERHQQKLIEKRPGKVSTPSLLDSNSSSVSSILPIDVAQAEGAPASILSPSPASGRSSRLSRHVENARKKSIWSPSASETTCTPASLDNETNGVSSLTAEIGSSQADRIGAKPLSSLLSTKISTPKTEAETTAPKVGGLVSRPLGARVAALEAQYRKGKFTVRGARVRGQDDNEEKKLVENEKADAPLDHEEIPDPILGVSHTTDELDYEHQYGKDDETEQEEEVYDYDGEDSVHNSTNSHGVQDYEVCVDDDEESTLPDYSGNQTEGDSVTGNGSNTRASEFIAYNDRQNPNTDGVFQFQSKSGTAKGKNTSTKASSGRKSAHRSRDRDKKAIQPLFSSERLDENNNDSIHESSIRSRSLGRSNKHPSNHIDKQGTVGLPRRSKSLSERKERRCDHDYHPFSSIKQSEVMATISRDHRERSNSRPKHQATRHPVPGNIVVKNEDARTDKGREESRTKSSSIRSSIQCDPLQTSTPIGTGETVLKSSENGYSSTKERPTSIKDKIRAFNLKTSPTTHKSTGIPKNEKTSVDQGQLKGKSIVYGQNSRDQNSLSKVRDEEKKEEERDGRRLGENDGDCGEQLNRNKLERKSAWARFLVEKGNNYDDDRSISSTNDDYSVQSLREQFEQMICTSNNDAPGDEDDDDRSVRNLREVFEPPEKKSTGDTISNLKARFESKPRSLRSSFTKPSRSPRERNSGIENSNTTEKSASGIHGQASGVRDIADADAKPVQDYQWWILEEKHPPSVDGDNKVQTTPMFKNVHNRLNEWSKRHQIEPKSIALDMADRRRNGKDPNPTFGSDPPRDQRTHLKTVTSERNESSSSQQKFFGDDEARQSPSENSTRRVPGSHWTSQSARSDRENVIQKNGTKESTSDSDYSDAVTLDPSFADVSNLSNPSAIRSPESSYLERHSDASSSSVLFENLASSGEQDGVLGTSSSEIVLPKLNGKEFKNEKLVSKKLNATYEVFNSHSVVQSDKTVMEESGGKIVEDLPRVVTPDYEHVCQAGPNYFKRHENADHHFHADGSSRSPRPVTLLRAAVRHSDQKFSNQGYESPSGLRQPKYSPYRILESSNHYNQQDTQLQDSEVSDRSMEIYSRPTESSSRSSRSSETPFQSLYRSTRFEDNRNVDVEPYTRPSEAMTTPGPILESSSRSTRSLETPRRETETSNRTSRSAESLRDSLESPSRYTGPIGTPKREVEPPKKSILSLGTPRRTPSNFQENHSSISFQQKSNPLDGELSKEYWPSEDRSRLLNTADRQNHPSGTSKKASKQPVVPPMPSPFDENYATIMESRHKMLLVRQRALLNRRANREKLQNSQHGFFGKTNPRQIDANSSTPPHNYHSTFSTEGNERSGIKGMKAASSSSDGLETPALNSGEEPLLRPKGASTHDPYQTRDIKEMRVTQSPVTSIFARFRPTFGISPNKDKGNSQKQAVIDRISAIRAARLRRNHAYGDTTGSKNYEAAQAYRLEKVLPKKLDTIADPVPGYRYYPHNESIEPRVRDDDQSLSTNESNAQEYAAKLSID